MDALGTCRGGRGRVAAWGCQPWAPQPPVPCVPSWLGQSLSLLALRFGEPPAPCQAWPLSPSPAGTQRARGCGTVPGRTRCGPAAAGTAPGPGTPRRPGSGCPPWPSPKPLIHLSQQEMPKLPFHAGSSARELAALSIPGAGGRCVGQAGGIPPLPARSRCA